MSLAEVLNILQTEAQKSGKTIADMFGSAEAGKAAMSILSNGVDGFNASVEEMIKSTGATETAFGIMADTTENKMATAIFRFHISEPQPQSVIVPQGTRINFDGEIVFSTTEELEIHAGDTYGDVLGECQTAGIVGNNIATGQIKEIMDTYDFYWKVENITRTAGGADKESDQSYYERLRESVEGFSTAGPVGGYIYHVKSVSTAITDVTATSPEPGLVDIRVLLNGGEMPTEATMQEIQDALNASTVRPLTDRVIVSKPEEPRKW